MIASLTSAWKVRYELRLVIYSIGLYVFYIYWGFLKEKLQLSDYPTKNVNGDTIRWKFAAISSFIQSIVALIVVHLLMNLKSIRVPGSRDMYQLQKIAALSSVESWIGFFTLNYVNQPSYLVSSALKPLPLMIFGMLLYRRKYSVSEIVSVLVLCTGAIFFNFGGRTFHPLEVQNVSDTLPSQSNTFVGTFLIAIDMLVDGLINNEEDKVFRSSKISHLEMMKVINMWQSFYLFCFLLIQFAIKRQNSDFYLSAIALIQSVPIRCDLMQLALSAAFGQILIFTIIREFGTLTWVTISVTRKLLAVVLSVVLFDHRIKAIQWLGFALVFFSVYSIEKSEILRMRGNGNTVTVEEHDN